MLTLSEYGGDGPPSPPLLGLTGLEVGGPPAADQLGVGHVAAGLAVQLVVLLLLLLLVAQAVDGGRVHAGGGSAGSAAAHLRRRHHRGESGRGRSKVRRRGLPGRRRRRRVRGERRTARQELPPRPLPVIFPGGEKDN